jgi:hypothetical protein
MLRRREPADRGQEGSASVTNSNPRAALVTCRRCRGMGGFSRGETAFDCCDGCEGEGKVHVRLCTAEMLGERCGERLFITRYRHDEPLRTGWGCINGHRWERVGRPGAMQWERAEDRVETVAS